MQGGLGRQVALRSQRWGLPWGVGRGTISGSEGVADDRRPGPAGQRAPTQAADAIRGVWGTTREALAETRRLLGILRAEGGQELRQPLPGLSDLEGLFTRVRTAGLPVRYERSGIPVTRRLAFSWLSSARPGSSDEHDRARRPGREPWLRLAPGEVRVI